MLFTSTIAPFRTSPSAQFKERGDSNGFPGTCVQTHIFSISTASKEGWPLYRGMIPQIAIANVSNAPTSPPGLAVWLRQVPILYPFPQVGISFNNPSEATLGAIYSQGFVQDANGRTKYYRGTPKVDQVGSIISLNPNVNTFVPAGVCDLDGFKAFIITSRVLTTMMTAFPTDLTTPILFSSDGTPSIPLSRDLPGSYKIPAMEEILAGNMPMAYPLNQSSQDFHTAGCEGPQDVSHY